MNKIIILPLFMLVLNTSAQIDTAYLPPFAYLTYNTSEWEIEDHESDHYSFVHLIGKMDAGLNLQIQLAFGDTTITRANLFANLNKNATYGAKMELESFEEFGDYFIGVFKYTQDECSRNGIPAILRATKFRAAFLVIDQTNLLTIKIDNNSFFFPEERQTEKILEVVRSIHVVSPSKLDKLLKLPLTKENAEEIIKEAYPKSYKEYFDFCITTSSCIDDSYFNRALKDIVDYSRIDSLIKHAPDSTLCDMIARYEAERDTTSLAVEVRNKLEFGFNYAERTELFKKARNESFSLEEYLDYQLSEAKEGPIRRLKGYVNLHFDYSDKIKYSDVTGRLFGQKFLPEYDIYNIKFLTLGDHKYVLKIETERRDTIYETLFFHLQKPKNSYEVTPIPIPQEIAEKPDKSFDKNYFTPNNIYDVKITPSPEHQLLLLSQSSAGKAYFPSFVNIGNSKDINWIPVSSVDFDSSKFILIKRNYSLEFDFFTASNTEITWDQFDNNVEKDRLNNLFKSSFGVSLDKAANVNTRTEEWNAGGLAMIVNEERLFEGSDVTISNKELIYFLHRNVQLDNLAYKIEGIEDLNNDGNEDVYSILISNGKVIAAKAYIFNENSYELISTEEVVNLLKSNNGFQNMLLISQIGNHGENEVTSNSDLFDITK